MLKKLWHKLFRRGDEDLESFQHRIFMEEAGHSARASGFGYTPSVEYHPDMIYGFCARCKLTGAMTQGMAQRLSVKQMDAIVHGRVIRLSTPICPNRLPNGDKCESREFVPLQLQNGQSMPGLELLRRSYQSTSSRLPREDDL